MGRQLEGLLGANRQLGLIHLDLHFLAEIEAGLPKPFAGEAQGGHLVLILKLPADRQSAEDRLTIRWLYGRIEGGSCGSPRR